jgi:hypothetical protein
MTGGVSRYTHVAPVSAKADMGEDETISKGQKAVLIAVFVKLWRLKVDHGKPPESTVFWEDFQEAEANTGVAVVHVLRK